MKITLTLRVIAKLLSYPDADLRRHLPELNEALCSERALKPGRLAEVQALMARLAGHLPLLTEAEYVELFDRGRATSLHLFEHVHGDSRDRGPAMIDLVKTFEQAGLMLTPGELPDYLPVMLEYASTQPELVARELLREFTHILLTVFSALVKRQSPYASLIAALLELAGEKAQPVALAAEPDIDTSWAEPVVFDGCSTAGQARPGQPQPIRIVRAPSGAINPATSPPLTSGARA